MTALERLFFEPSFPSLFSFPLRHFNQDVSVPRVEIVPGDEDVVVKVGLSGVSPEDVSVDVNDGLLTISTAAQSQKETEDAKTAWYSSWETSFRLPSGTDVDAIKAEFDNGLLKVRVPKSSVGSRKVEIAHTSKEAPQISQDKKEGTETG